MFQGFKFKMVFHSHGDTQNGWFIREKNPLKWDDLGLVNVPMFHITQVYLGLASDISFGDLFHKSPKFGTQIPLVKTHGLSPQDIPILSGKPQGNSRKNQGHLEVASRLDVAA